MHSILASASAPEPSSVAFPEADEDEDPSPLLFSSYSPSPPAMPPYAAALNGEKSSVPPPLVAAGRDESGASSSRPIFVPGTTSSTETTASQFVRDDRELPRLGTDPVSIGNPHPPQLRLRTATSLPAGWYNSDVGGRSGYTSLRELMENSPTHTDGGTCPSPAYNDLRYSPPHTHHNRQSRNQYSVTIDSIAIRNPLLKHAAFAYLRPTTPPAPAPKRSWLLSQPRGHPDDDGRPFAEGGEGFLCSGVGFVAGWVAGVVRPLFHRMCGRDGSEEPSDRVKNHGQSDTNGPTVMLCRNNNNDDDPDRS